MTESNQSILVRRFAGTLTLAVGTAAFLLPLLAYAYTGWFMRFLADDYCFSAALRQFGFWKAQPWFYMTTSNRFPVLFFIGIGEKLSAANVQIWPALTILLWFLALVTLIWQANRWIGGDWPRLAIPFVAAVVLFFTLLEAPDRLQSLYWRSGQVTYSFPLVLFTFNLAWMVSRYRRSQGDQQQVGVLALLGIGLLAFVAGGGSETFNVLQSSQLALGLFLAATALRDEQRRSAETILSTALVGSLLAMLLLVISPGNERRFSVLPETPPFLELLTLSLRFGWDFIVDSLRTQPLPNLLSLAVAVALGFTLPLPAAGRKSWLWLLGIPVVLYLSMVAVALPSVYAESAYPEYRALMVGRYVMVFLLLAWGFITGWHLRTWLRSWPVLAYAGLALLLLASLYPLRSAVQIVRAIPAERQWAVEWNQRDQAIRQQVAEGAFEVQVREFDSRGTLAEYGSEPDFWVNRCAADFYGLSSLVGIP